MAEERVISIFINCVCAVSGGRGGGGVPLFFSHEKSLLTYPLTTFISLLTSVTIGVIRVYHGIPFIYFGVENVTIGMSSQ